RRHTRSLRDWSSDVCSSDLRGRNQSPRFLLGGDGLRHPPRRDGLAPEIAAEVVGELGGRLVPSGDGAGNHAVEIRVDVARARGRSEERRVGKGGRAGWEL